MLALPLVPTEASPLPIEFDPSITDWIGAVGGVLLGIGTILVAVLAYRAQRQADAARRDSEAAQVTALEAQTQAANAQVDAMRFLADALNHNESLAADAEQAGEGDSESDADGEPETDTAGETDTAPVPEPEPTPTPEREPEQVEQPGITSRFPGRPARGERPERGGGRSHRHANVRWGAKLDGDRGFALTNVGSEPAFEVTVMAQNFGGGGGGRRPPTTHTIAEIAPGQTSTIAAAFDSGAFARMLIVRWRESDGVPHVERIVAA